MSHLQPSSFYIPGETERRTNNQIRVNPVARSISPLQSHFGGERLDLSQSRINQDSIYSYTPGLQPHTSRLNSTPQRATTALDSQQGSANLAPRQLVSPGDFRFKDFGHNDSAASKQLGSTDSSRRQSRYSPLRRVYDESRSPSVISHLNTSINEALRAQVDGDGQVKKFAAAFEQVTASNLGKLEDFLDSLQRRLRKMNQASQRAIIDKFELEKLHEDERYFMKKSELALQWIHDLRRRIEDREMIFRALHKQSLSKRPVSDYLSKKAQEIETDNEREKESLQVRLDMFSREHRELESEIQNLDRVIKAKENEWVIRDHQHTVQLEQEARDEMNKQSYQIVLQHFKAQANNPAFAKPRAQLEELLAIRNHYERQFEEAKLLASEDALRKEISRLEKVLAAKGAPSKNGDYSYQHRPGKRF